ncbi:hypothetical protein FSW04_18735 [Baekduia soli]|uniref:Uncharacterized protein n=1 Tax=Baekduia soli TaxID=496014 RepID=A0A5B8U8T8_9ACTN|nr:hypothetical protein [Baekduia soli]QEC49405.1 hypothetical protein FSW04_18735 [Baekduia soli]
MAQTKRKRRTKHRGNAAGMVESRGRTGRAPTASERAKTNKALRSDRLDRPPSWRSAANRAGIASVLFIVVVAVLQKNIVMALAIGLLMFAMYVPLGYYTDAYIYKRRQAKKAQGKL